MSDEFYVREIKHPGYHFTTYIVFINGVSTYTYYHPDTVALAVSELKRRGYKQVPDPWAPESERLETVVRLYAEQHGLDTSDLPRRVASVRRLSEIGGVAPETVLDEDERDHAVWDDSEWAGRK